jgi:hypothetical protein
LFKQISNLANVILLELYIHIFQTKNNGYLKEVADLCSIKKIVHQLEIFKNLFFCHIERSRDAILVLDCA